MGLICFVCGVNERVRRYYIDKIKRHINIRKITLPVYFKQDKCLLSFESTYFLIRHLRLEHPYLDTFSNSVSHNVQEYVSIDAHKINNDDGMIVESNIEKS